MRNSIMTKHQINPDEAIGIQGDDFKFGNF